MIQTQHRAVARPAGTVAAQPGGAPGGMWAVAWRQHRLQIAVLLAVMAASAAALVWFRWRIVSVYEEFGCALGQSDPSTTCTDAQGMDVWWNYGFSSLSALAHMGMVAGPIVLGAFAAAPIFTREFSRGTHVFALTQSVGRARWFTTKTVTMLVPLVAGLAVLGYLMEWVDKTVGATAHDSLAEQNFFARGIVPAATGLAAFGLTIAIGMLIRNVAGALTAGLIVGIAVLIGVVVIQPRVLPAQRTVTPLAQVYAPVTQAQIDTELDPQAPANGKADPDARYRGSGYLDASGTVVSLTNSMWQACSDASTAAGNKVIVAAGLTPPDFSGNQAAQVPPEVERILNSPEYRNAGSAAWLSCVRSHGVAAQYSDVLPGSMLWPLRWAITGICALLAALGIGLGAWRLRHAIAKR